MARRRPSFADGAVLRDVPIRDGAVKARGALTYEAALTRVVRRLTLPVAVRIACVTARTLQDWSDPDSPRTCPIHVAERLDAAWRAAGGTGRPLTDTLIRRLELAAERAARPLAPGATLDDCFAEVLTESAQAKAAVFAATRPGASATQHALAAREVEESIAAWSATLPHLVQPPP